MIENQNDRMEKRFANDTRDDRDVGKQERAYQTQTHTALMASLCALNSICCFHVCKAPPLNVTRVDPPRFSTILSFEGGDECDEERNTSFSGFTESREERRTPSLRYNPNRIVLER